MLGSDLLSDWDRAVSAYGDATALTDACGSWSFSRLDELTSAIGGALASRGVGPEVRVGLALNRPAHYVLGIVSVLKAGGAFVAIDRVSHRAAASQDGNGLADFWLVSDPGDAIERDRVIELSSGMPKSASRSWSAGFVSPAQLAYVLYTSGSTGAPKGIMIERQNLTAFVRSTRSSLRLSAADRWFQVASPGFDVFLEETLPVLLAGGSVACPAELAALDPACLHLELQRAVATIVELSTQHWYEYARWLRSHKTAPPAHLRLVVIGGERMDSGEYRDWQQRYPVALAHVYGLTETTVSTSFFTGLVADGDGHVPLGSPISGSSVTIVAPDHGVGPGEICIGGAGVGRGYLGDPGGTAERFVPDPLGPPGSRAFATGDLALLARDGPVFVGRLDDQVKLRGRRLELGEVEVALSNLDGVDQSVAVLAGSGELCAFVVPANAEALGEGSRLFLDGVARQRLLAPLVNRLAPWKLPTIVVLLARLPHTAHGKIDRAGLAASVSVALAPASRGDGGGTISPPQSDAAWDDDYILTAFRAVLGLPALGPDDDFFEHGGNSLLALRLIALLRDSRPATTISAASVFDAPTANRLRALTGGDGMARSSVGRTNNGGAPCR